MNLIPRISFDQISTHDFNRCLTDWGHKMGTLNRPFPSMTYALFDHHEPVCVVSHSCLIVPNLGNPLEYVTRENSIELSRLCSSRPGLCRIVLRLWREFVFPGLRLSYAVSYQDADLHTGNTYRFDGWKRLGFSSSGTDTRSGSKGRRKWIWIWGGKA